MSLELQPGFVDVGVPAPVQVQEIVLESNLKNPSQTDPQGFAAMAEVDHVIADSGATLVVDGGGRVPRQVRFVAQALRHPVAFARSLSVWHWSERTVVLLAHIDTAQTGLMWHPALLRKGAPSPATVPLGTQLPGSPVARPRSLIAS